MLNDLFHIGVGILSTAVDSVTKTVLAQLGSVTESYTYSDNAEWYQHVGFSSRPSKPDGGHRAAEGIAIKGSRDVVIASRDIRGQEIYGNLKDGETSVYASGADGTAQGRLLIKGDSSVNLYTRTDSGAKGMLISMTPSSDTIAIVNAAGFGIVIDPTGVRLTSKDAGLTLQANGDLQLTGKGVATLDGGTVMVGVSAIPSSAPLNSAIHGPTGVAGIASSKVLIGA